VQVPVVEELEDVKLDDVLLNDDELETVAFEVELEAALAVEELEVTTQPTIGVC